MCIGSQPRYQSKEFLNFVAMKDRQTMHAVWTKFLGSAQNPPGGNEGLPCNTIWIGLFFVTLWF